MPLVTVVTEIPAPIEVVFDLARDVDIHTATSTGDERILFATRPQLELGDEVEFEARHFGIRRRLRARITEFARPHSFTDEQVSGPFRVLVHRHWFSSDGFCTQMRDEFRYEVFGGLLLAPYFRRFLVRRGLLLREIAMRRQDPAYTAEGSHIGHTEPLEPDGAHRSPPR